MSHQKIQCCRGGSLGFGVGALLICWLTLASARAQDLESVRQMAHRGDYAEALEALELAENPRLSLPQRLLAAEILAEVGREEEAMDLLESVAVGQQPDAEASLLYAELTARRGRLQRALRLLDDVIDLQPLLARAYFQRGWVYGRLGQLEAAHQDFDLLIQADGAGLMTAAPELALAATAYHRLGQYEAANAAYATALELAPSSHTIRIEWGRLLLQKYRPDQARELALEVLAENPRHARALVLLANSNRALDETPAVVAEQARRALETNPHLDEAYELLARQALDEGDYSRAVSLLDGVLTRNEARLEALALQGAAHFLADRRRGYRHVSRRVFEINSHYADFYVVVGDYAAQVFRYDDALDLYERALDMDPNHATANLGMGIGLSRQADDEGARRHLEHALAVDPFNERAYRMVRFYNETAADYDLIESDRFRFRFERSQRPVLEAYLPPLVEEVYAHYQERYGVTLEAPLAVELFADAETYAVRSSGQPHIGPYGVCFGRLITARSPTTGDFNWAELVAHELSHAFTLASSDARVPRWLGEGIAEWDTSRLRPHWHREGDFDLMLRLRRGELPGVAELDRTFVRARSLDDIRAAYAQSTLTVQFIVSGWGSESVQDILRLLGERRGLADVLTQVTGLDLAAFDEAFEQFLRERLAGLLETFEPDLSQQRDLDSLQARLSHTQDDAELLAELAVANLQARRIDEAESAVERALSVDEQNALARFVAGLLALQRRRFDDAGRRFEALVADGFDGYSLRTELAYLARQQGRSNDALTHYERALAIYPDAVEPLVEMADIHLRAAQRDDAIVALERAMALDQHRIDVADRLLQLLVSSDRVQDARRVCERAHEIQPFDAERHQLCGRLALEQGDREAASRELELALILGINDEAEVRRLLEQADAAAPRAPRSDRDAD